MKNRSFFIIVTALIVGFFISACFLLSPYSDPSSPSATQIPPKAKLPPEMIIPKKISTLISYATVFPVPGNQYWISACEDPVFCPSSWVSIYTLPGEPLFDPAVVLINTITNATLVTLIGVQDEYCYVEGFGPTINCFSDLPFEGWLSCDLLLTHKPTPVPTLNLTPQRP